MGSLFAHTSVLWPTCRGTGGDEAELPLQWSCGTKTHTGGPLAGTDKTCRESSTLLAHSGEVVQHELLRSLGLQNTSPPGQARSYQMQHDGRKLGAQTV